MFLPASAMSAHVSDCPNHQSGRTAPLDTRANVRKILENMTVREKIGQLSQYNANLFIDTDAAVTGDMQWLGISDEDLNYVGHVLNFKSSVEMRKIQEKHLEKTEGEYTKICYGADYDTGYIINSVIVETDGWVSKTDVANTQKAAAERRATEEAVRKAREKAEREAREKAAKEKAAKEAARKASQKSSSSSAESSSSYTAPPTSNKGQAIVNEAKKYLGIKYVYGGSSPKGFDCSGLVQYVCRTLGISVNRTAAAQFSNGRAVKKSDLQPGDLVFFAKKGRIHHVGIYAGNGQMIHAPHTGDVVRYASLNSSYRVNGYAAARRVY